MAKKRKNNEVLPWWTYNTKEEDARESNERYQEFTKLSEDIGLEELEAPSFFR